MKKRCRTCKKLLDAGHFAWDGKQYRPDCNPCRKARSGWRPSVTLPPEPRPAFEQMREHQRDLELDHLRKERKELLKSLNLAEKRQGMLDVLERFSAPPVRALKRDEARREATAVVLASDWHVEELVESHKVNGLNRYDLEVAEQRIERLADAVLWMLETYRAKFDIPKLVLWLGGDLMTGYIHEELMESNQLSPAETLLWLQQRIVWLIDVLVKRSGCELLVPCTRGNHGRTTDRQRISTGAENSFEWLLYQQLAQHYESEKKVTVLAPKAELIYLRVYDRVIRFAHGDQIGYQGGIGGLSIPLNKAIASWDVGQRADVTCIGHWHQYLSTPRAVVNGSLIGYSPYSVRIKAAYEDPQQAFFLVDSKRGVCCASPLWVAKS